LEAAEEIKISEKYQCYSQIPSKFILKIDNIYRSFSKISIETFSSSKSIVNKLL
jgi:hypothetical protein